MRGDEILLAASLTMKAGEYAITVSAVGESGEERAAVTDVTVDALPLVPSGDSTPPVVLLNGWQFSVFPPSSCPISTSGSSETFGSLATHLVAPEVYFFDNCVEQSVNGSTIEELGVTLGQFLNMVQYAGGPLVPQIDLVSHSMGGLIVRSYLAGLQANDALSPALNPRVRKFIEIATPNFGSFLAANYSDLLANGTQTAEMVPGSNFLWTLGTWNQRGDDLRGVDALAIIGNAGYWKSSIFATTQLNNASDGVVSFTSASLNFARDPSRTRILPYCHIGPDSSAYPYIDCSGKGGIANVDEAPETGVMILSFLANTTAWEAEGYANQTQFGGGYFALENAAGTQYTPFSSVLLGSQSFETGWTNTIFYNEFVSPETGTFTATSTANQTSTCGTFAVTGGTFSIFRCKFNPVISSVGPLLPNVAGRVVTSGGSITISGVGFGQQCSVCQVLAYPGPVALQVSSWTDAVIAALLPSTFNGIAEVVVQASGGSDAINFMAAQLAPVITVAPQNLQFAYTIGGAVPPGQSVQVGISTTGIGWSASASASWLSVTPASSPTPSTFTVSVSPAGLATGTYNGNITVSALGAVSQAVAVTLMVSGPPVASPMISSIVNAASFQPGIVPGSLATLFGKNLSPVNGIVLPGAATSYDGVTLTVQSVQVPLLAVANVNGLEQINFQVPFEITGSSTAQVQVNNGGSIGAFTVPILATQPGIFEYIPAGSTTNYGAVLKADGSTVGPNNPASRGNVVSIYVTGMGATSPAMQTGQLGPSSPPATTALQPSVSVGGVAAQVLFSGYAPGFLGLYQINFIVPSAAPVGSSVTLEITVGNAASQTSHIAVE